MELFKKSEGQSYLPNRLMARELRNVHSAALIKAILYVYIKAGEALVSLNELLSDRAFVALFKDIAEAKKALTEATAGQFILALPVNDDIYYFAASKENYQSLLQTQKNHPPPKTLDSACTVPNIYVLYEENIGILSPLVAQELSSMEEQYPVAWIHEAFKEAVLQNKKSLKYIMRILQNRLLDKQPNIKDKYTQGEYSRHAKH